MLVQTLQARIFEVNVSDEVEHEFMTSSKLRQREIYNTLLFEFQNNDVHFFNCTSCHGRYFWTGGIENSRTKCDDCISSNLNETKLLQENMLPVWKDDNGKTRFDQPEELQDLSYGEMLCIQVKALLFPSTHLWNGKYGLKGHTVVFNKDITSVVDELPRSKVEVVNVMRNYSEGDEIKVQNFRIRKSKIMKALKFLKKHHPSYKNITIKESNLDWCGNDENATILKCIECDLTREEPENKETVSEKQTIQDEELLESYGIALNEAMDKENPESNEVLKDLQVHDKGVCLDYPQISEDPVDEYLEPHLFADIYPWCFPSGLGDVLSLVRQQKSKALEWTRRLLHYYDGRFASDPCLTFHLLNYIQRHVNNRDALFFVKDNFCTKNKTMDDLRDQVANNDMSFVKSLQHYASYNIRGSDPWWRSRKHELDSWIAHHLKEGNGPPTLFMTFSCAEYWWNDLRKFLIERCKNTVDSDLADLLKTGSEKQQKTAQAKLVDKYSYCVQQFFQLRIDNWLETVGKNVFKIKHYYLRFEFAKGRGQIHAHMLAITSDNQYIAEFYENYNKKRNICEATSTYSEYARKRLKLTAEKPTYNFIEAEDFESLKKDFTTTDDIHMDLNGLIQDTHLHFCNQFCLKTNPKTKKRECRAGCGKEDPPNSNDTPGFPLSDIDFIEVDYKRKTKFLTLRRTERRMKQTSTSMLQSWRANCDVSVIVYDTDPTKICPQDIAQISGYVVAYCTKGNASYKKEQIVMSKVIADYEDDLLAGDKHSEDKHILKLSRRMLNSLSTSRIISKAEASVELLNADLFWCTESFSHVRLSKASRLMSSENENFYKTKDKINEYIERNDDFKDFSLAEFITYLSTSATQKVQISDFEKKRLRHIQKSLKTEILHGVGMNGNPIFPPTESYAKATLLMHKPWSTKHPLEFDLNATRLSHEFYEFLSSEKCPLDVILNFFIAKENHERSEKTADIENNDEELERPGGYDDDLDFYLEALHNIKLCSSKYKECYQGADGFYDFHKRFTEMDPKNEDENWLKNKRDEYFTEEMKKQKVKIHNPQTGSPYDLKDVGENFSQQQIIYAVTNKLKEWIEFPQAKKSNPNLKFQPLFLTVMGEGGTGKSHVIRILTNVVESLFDEKISITCAPTGNAAYNVNGKTCHSFFSIGFKNKSKNGKLSQAKQDKLKNSLNRLLMITLDERSLLSCEVLAKMEETCSKYAHGGHNNKVPWGGIPIVLFLGDDMQLPAVKKNNKGGGATTIFDEDGSLNHNTSDTKMHRRGQRLFREIATNVIRLSTNQRINKHDKLLQRCCQSLRTGPGISKKDAQELLQYRFENPKLSHEKRLQLIDKAIWIFTTNREVQNHNFSMIEKLVERSNPLIYCSYKIQSKDGKKNFGLKSHFENEDVLNAPIALCRGARVSIDRNIWQEVGLFNGALGTVVDIRYEKNKSPLKGDFPEYIIVDMDNYDGPVWDMMNPTHVPIPVAVSNCQYGCCKMTSVPLNISFARTLHKFQGQAVGPKQTNKYMVFGPGTTTFESMNPGLLYVGLSRMVELGDTIDNGSFYFFGVDANEDRLTNVIFKRKQNKQRSFSKYKSVLMRDHWIQYLNDQQQLSAHNFNFTIDEKIQLQLWLQTTHISTRKLDEIIHFHNSCVN